MHRQLRIFLAGIMVVIPFAVTAYVVWRLGAWLDEFARAALNAVSRGAGDGIFTGLGAAGVLAGIYLVGLLTHWWVFRWAVRLLERIVARVPGVKTLYESTRDIMGLFAGEGARAGQAVHYRVPGTEIRLLGILTSRAPKAAGGQAKVAVYLPMSYQLGGYTVYVPPESVEPLEMSVEEAMKLAATAGVGGHPDAPGGGKQAPPRSGGGGEAG